jgi:hypothetical protein
MESLKKLDEVCSPDPRTHAFTLLDANHPGFFRKRTLQDFHRAAETIILHDGVPEAVRNHFQTARNLIIYSWFYYPFNVTAQLCAYTSVEMAVRAKLSDRKTAFKSLLKKAVAAGLISDKGFSIPKLRKQAIQRHNKGLPENLRLPEPQLLTAYSNAVANAIPFLRNELAHGNPMLHEQGAKEVRICSELINQLWPRPSWGSKIDEPQHRW